MEKTDKAITFIHDIEQKLRTVYQDTTLCRQYAWWILEEITRHDKEQLLSNHIIQLNDTQMETIKLWLHKLVDKHIPIQYLIGTIPFNGIEILLEPPILIPRPETEEWVVKLIKQLKSLADQKLSILDIGTGTGCIALALAHELPQATVYATDISEKAIKLGHINAIHNGITNAHFIKSNVFNGIPHVLRFDVIVSNPPYISQEEWTTLNKSVTEWEDKAALVAPDKGLSIIETIINQACCFIKLNDELIKKEIPNVIIEIGYNQANDVSNLMKNADFSMITIEKDLEGKDRVALGRVESCGPCHHSTNGA